MNPSFACASGSWERLARDREAEVVGAVNTLEPVPLVPGQRAEEAVGDDGARGGLEVGDGLPQVLGLLALVELTLGQHARRRGQSFGEFAHVENLPLSL